MIDPRPQLSKVPAPVNAHVNMSSTTSNNQPVPIFFVNKKIK